MNLVENLYINLDIKAFKRILLNLLANTIRYRKNNFQKLLKKHIKKVILLFFLTVMTVRVYQKIIYLTYLKHTIEILKQKKLYKEAD